MIRPFRFLRCVLRNYHRMMVADMAQFSMMESELFRGRCRDCGFAKWREGWYWQKQKARQEAERLLATGAAQLSRR